MGEEPGEEPLLRGVLFSVFFLLQVLPGLYRLMEMDVIHHIRSSVYTVPRLTDHRVSVVSGSLTSEPYGTTPFIYETHNPGSHSFNLNAYVAAVTTGHPVHHMSILSSDGRIDDRTHECRDV